MCIFLGVQANKTQMNLFCFWDLFNGFSAYHSKHVWSENLIYLLLILLVLNVEIVVPTADQYARRLGASESPLAGCNERLGRDGAWPRWGEVFGHWGSFISWEVYTLENERSILHPQSLKWNLKMIVSKVNLLFQGLIFRFHA